MKTHDVRDTMPVDPEELAAALSPPRPLSRGAQVGRYLVLDLLGQGGMGVVYSAFDPRLDRRIALKVLRPDASGDGLLKQRLLREAQAMARLVHANVRAVYDAGESEDLVYLAMELIKGRTLRAWLDESPRPWRKVVDVYAQAGRGLAAAHRAGLVHRDFKPDNVLLADDGRVVVSDFGVAHVTASAAPSSVRGTVGEETPPPSLALTQAGTLIGTPAYMAPEQLAGEPVDSRADMYAFAVAVWESVHRQHPVAHDDFQSLRTGVLRGALREPPRSRVPRRVSRALLPALRRDPAERPETLDEILDALTARPGRRILLAVAVAATVALMIVLGGAIRSAAEARASAREARAQAELARTLGQEVKELELGLRAQRLLPLHDVGPAERRVRARLERMRASLTGRPGEAAIHDALGRGLAALGDHDGARAELEHALRHGVRDPALHWTLGLSLLRLHTEALGEARRMGGPAWVAARKAELGAQFLPAARAHLEQSRGATLAPPRVLEALIAYEEGDLTRALAEARAAAREAPLFYEAQLLVGKILDMQAEAAHERGEWQEADRLRAAAILELEAAAFVARSDARVHDAIADLWIRRLDQRRYGSFSGELVLVAGALMATDRSIAAAPHRAGGHLRRARAVLMAVADAGTMSPAIETLFAERCLEAGGEALRLAPRDAIVLDTLANCRGVLAARAIAEGRDPTGDLRASEHLLRRAIAISPGLPWISNDLSVTAAVLSEYQLLVGRDALATAHGAVVAAERAMRLDASDPNPHLNMLNAFGFFAEAGARRGHVDEAVVERARAVAARSYTLHEVAPFAARINLLLGLVARLRLLVLRGDDATQALEEVDRLTAEAEHRLAPEWRRGQPEQFLLEIQADSALLAAEAGRAPGPAIAAARRAIDRCLDIDPGRVACRMLGIRLAWLEAATTMAGPRRRASLERALRLADGMVATFGHSGRVHAARAESHRRLAGDGAPDHVAPGLRAATLAVEIAPALADAQAVLGRLSGLEASSAASADARRAAAGRALAALELAGMINPALARRLAAERDAALAALR